MGKNISRKTFFRSAAKYLVGAAAGATGLNVISPAKPAAGAGTRPLPWPYLKLDPELVRTKAHDYFYDHGCCYAGFAGVLLELQEKVGDPFKSIPAEMMSYGGSGVKGWGTLCGALNGAFAAINLVSNRKAGTNIINTLMGWYTQTPLPSSISNRFAENDIYTVDKGIKTLPQSTSGSPLCHISTTKWCVASGYHADSVERFERCARLSGDVAAKTVELLNVNANSQLNEIYTQSESTSDCLNCHGSKEAANNVAAKMDCVQCHDGVHNK